MPAGFTRLDIKIALRMLVKHPGVTIVGGVAIAFAMAVGAVLFELLTQGLHPILPLPDGQRVVGVRLWDAVRHSPERHVAYDYLAWRESLQSLEALGAFRSSERNLAVQDGEAGEPIALAEMTASGFRTAGVAPLLGRVLVEDDERTGSMPLVIGHALWQQRFGADPSVVGRSVWIGRDVHSVIGVMPEGFGFPLAHEAWVPLVLDGHAWAPREGPQLQVFGRLAEGATIESAQAELTAWGERRQAEHPDTHAQLRPQVLPFAESILPFRLDLAQLATVWSFNLVPLLFALLVFANVAMLVFARAAMREGELLVRNALGASRSRIVMQLFAEALVLGGIAATVGLLAAEAAVGHAIDLFEIQLESPLPFWMQPGLSLRTIVYAAALTLFGAAMVGVLPALKVTGRNLPARLQQRSAGAGGLRFGGVWTAVIVAQVAITVAFPLTVYLAWRDADRIASQEAGMDTSRFLSVRVETDRYDDAGRLADAQRVTAARARLERQLESDPAVAGVTFATQLPRMYHPWRRVEIDAGEAVPTLSGPGYRLSGAWVAPDFFDTMDVPLLSGRGFTDSDASGNAKVVLVNQGFVEQALGGRNPIGRRLRYLAADEAWSIAERREQWYEIIGVVPDLAMHEGSERRAHGGIYHPLSPLASTLTDSIGPASAYMAVKVRGDPAAFASRLHAIAAAVDPDLRLYQLQPMGDIPLHALGAIQFWLGLLLAVSCIALVLSLAGIYAITSFTVARRTREIGIRRALGAGRVRLLRTIFARPLWQIVLGLLLGSVLGGMLMLGAEGGLHHVSLAGMATYVGYAALMLGVCLLACVLPTRRALRVQPTEALREE